MSTPQYLSVAVISDRCPGGPELAAATAAMLLHFDSASEITPYIVATSTLTGCRPALIRAGVTRGIAVAEPIKASLLNPQRVDLWLALDKSGEETAWALIKQAGPAPVGFYRGVFPDPVVPCDCALPDPPPEESFDAWLDFLVEQLAPWRDQIWEAFYLSS